MQYINTWYQALKLAALIITASLTVSSGIQAKLSESDPLPDLSTFELSGNIPDLRGKVVLIDFWASWCAPCKASFPAMDAIYREYKDDGFVILGVSVDTNMKAYKKFADKSKVSFPLVWDGQKLLVAEAQIAAMPTSMMIDKKGIIRSIHEGYLGSQTDEAYRKEIKALLEE